MGSPAANLALLPAYESPAVSLVHPPMPRALVLAGFATSTAFESGEGTVNPVGLAIPPGDALADVHDDPGQKEALLVDPDLQVAQALTMILGLERIRLKLATSVERGMETLEALDNRIAVVIVHLRPTGCALGFLAAQRGARHPAPVVVMKAREDHQGWAAAVSAGAAAFVDCPIDPAELHLAILRVGIG